jgi:hypothetical protein
MGRMLSDILDGDGYIQGMGALHFIDDYGTQKNCCLGVMECEAGIKFRKHSLSNYWVDSFGGSQMPSEAVASAAELDLALTEDEIDYFTDISREYDLDLFDDHSRMDVLAALNDAELSFRFIARVLRDTGWDVDVDALKEELQKV